ncbi:MAG: glycosyltransferase, partial [Solirubrobacterales bacterium]|nr:glycosyltransferase [Solirubrobacterales bacterium]
RRAFAKIDRAALERGFDVVHDHCGFTALAMADRLGTPLVHTLHGPFTPSTAAFYEHHGHKAALVGISEAQLESAPAGLQPVCAIPNPIDVGAWPLREDKDDYLLWVGRMTPEKGPHRAIAAARDAGVPLVLAGVVQPGQQEFFDAEIAPHLGSGRVRFIGEVAGPVKRSLFAGARGLLVPIRWEEPFGMVMVEALACGTPVIAFPEGAARELVIDGTTGFLVEDEAAMSAAIGRLPAIAAGDCRAWVAEHCDVDVVARRLRAGLPIGGARTRRTGRGPCLRARLASSTAAPSSWATASATCGSRRAASMASSATTRASSRAGSCGSMTRRCSCSGATRTRISRRSSS